MVAGGSWFRPMLRTGTRASLRTSDEPRPLRLGFARAAARFLPPGLSRRLTEVLYPASEGRRHDFIAVTKSITGSTFRGRTSDFYGHQFSVTGYFAWKNYAVARAVCAPGSTVIEVGANVGTETLAYSDVVGSSGHVYAIEPVPENQEALRALIRLNGWANVTIIPVALGSRRRSARFSLPPPNNSGTGYLMPTDEAASGRSIQLQGVRFKFNVSRSILSNSRSVRPRLSSATPRAPSWMFSAGLLSTC
jgi:FkbM family methyltransferase